MQACRATKEAFVGLVEAKAQSALAVRRGLGAGTAKQQEVCFRMRFYVTTRDGEEHELDLLEGITAMEVIRDDLGEEPFGLCGGMCSCASCHVYVDAAYLDRLPAMEEDESDMIEGRENRRSNSRLSCQIELRPELDGIRLSVAPEE